jgi:uncharacterized membrane protein
MRPVVFVLTCLLTSFTSVDAEQRRTPRVKMEVLGSFPGSEWTLPNAINNRGHVVGGAMVDDVWFAFIWTRERGFELIAESAFARDINDRGEVVGWWRTCADVCTTSAFLWTRSEGFRDLGPDFVASAINNRGDLVGHCARIGDLVPCTMRDGVLTLFDCGTSCRGGQFIGINAKGDIVGLLYDDNSETDAFLLRRDGSRVPLGPGEAWDVNDRGTIVGVTGNGRAAIWTEDALLSLNTAGTSIATGINARGSVVGMDNEWTRAFLWNPRKDSVAFLSDESSQAYDINDRGDVVGWNGDDAREAVIWRVRP